MKFTGERPTLNNEIVTSRMRYKLVIPHCNNKKVLDFGCGIGHGTYLLSSFAKDIIGYDCENEAIKAARNYFVSPNIKFTNEWGESALKDRDLVVSIECIEHLEKEDLVDCLSFCSKIVPTFLCTTPNGDLFYYKPKNLSERRGFHIWHYSYNELLELFTHFYKYVDVAGHAFDPNLGRFTGYTVYATNLLNQWDDKLLTNV